MNPKYDNSKIISTYNTSVFMSEVKRVRLNDERTKLHEL